MRSVFLVVAIAFVVAGSVAAKENVGASGAEENVRAVQSKLADEGCYFGEIDGAYSSDFSTALSRYQIRNGLPITGQLDAETSKALEREARDWPEHSHSPSRVPRRGAVAQARTAKINEGAAVRACRYRDAIPGG